MINRYITLLLLFSLATSIGKPQTPVSVLTLKESHILATQNYPLVTQRELIAKSASYAIDQHSKQSLPQINVYGQATYQSVVTEIPIQIPGMDVPSLDRDQYKLYGEISQNLYDGGLTRLGRQAIRADTDVKQQALEVALYKIKERVNQLYFGILLLDAQLAQHELLQEDLRAAVEKINAMIASGAALKSEGSLLEAESLNAKQQAIDLQTTRKAYLHMLGLFIGRPLRDDTLLEKPASPTISPTISRPEINGYALQKNGIDVERELLRAKNRPKLGLFVQAGIGRPALNMLSNDLEAYYYGGLRLSIPISGFYTLKKERAQLDLKEAAIDVQRKTFLFNIDLSRQQQQTEASKYEQLLRTDDAIIALRTSVKAAALAQLENGIINTADYVRETHAVSSARLSKARHELQLLKMQYDIRYTTGN